MKGNRIILGGMFFLTLLGSLRSQPPNGSLPSANAPGQNGAGAAVVTLPATVAPLRADNAPGQNGAGPANALMHTVHGQTMVAPSLSDCMPGLHPSCDLIYAGAGFYLLKPYLQSNTAYTVSTGSTNVVGENTATIGLTTSKSFDWNVNPAAAFWLGYTSPSGLGMRARYFFFDNSSSDAAISETGAQASAGQVISPSPFTPTTFPNVAASVPGRFNFGSPGFLLIGPGVPPDPIGQDNLLFSSSLKIDAVDAEATFAWQTGNWSIIGGAGGRYLNLAQSYHGVLTNSGGGTGGSETQTLDFSHRFTGGGPTISGLATWQVGKTNLALFVSARGSLLVGSTHQNWVFTQAVNDPAGIAGPPGSFTFSSAIPATSDSVLPVTEFELGLQYGWRLLNANWVWRASVVDQTYFGAGNASRTDGNLSLLGCQLSLGLNY